MGFFDTPADTPETISDKDYKKLQDRARKANPESVFSKKSVARRNATTDQRSKRWWS
jgi:hypothetical protein